MWSQSNPDAPVITDRREQGGWLVRNVDGTVGLQPFPPEWTANACEINPPDGVVVPANAIAFVHTHPYAKHEKMTGCEAAAVVVGGVKFYQGYVGDTSQADDDAITAFRQQKPDLIGIMIDKDQIVSFTGNATTEQFTPRCGY